MVFAVDNLLLTEGGAWYHRFMKLIHGDSLEELKKLPDNSVDSVVTDPPYGISFMGKKWDYDVPSVEVWEEVMRVLKHGGHALVACGTRTQHRMAVNLEDAGFEIRDIIAYIYGSGFPKSLNIGKAVDKLQGNERKELGRVNRTGKEAGIYGLMEGNNMETKGNSPYEGWGTALKPSSEYWTLVRKPLDSSSDIEYTKSICQTLFVEIVKKSSELNLNEKTQQDIAQWSAEKSISTLEDLFVVMDMLQSESEKSLSLNTVLSWLNILAGIWSLLNTYTISTVSNTIIELKILQSLEWENILQNITQVKNNQTDGLNANVLDAVSLLNALKLKLADTLSLTAQENASSVQLDPRVNMELWTLCRKPLEEKTVAKNVLKHGTGGINIDGSRVGTGGKGRPSNDGKIGFSKSNKERTATGNNDVNTQGRFPANLIHDGSDEVVEGFPDSKSSNAVRHNNPHKSGSMAGATSGGESFGFDDSGSASRFFYCAKSSRSERNRGLDCYVTVKYNTGICKEENMVAVALLKKVISDTEIVSFNIDESGENITVRCHKDTLSTTLTEINKIIELKTLNLLTHSLTKEYTLGAKSEKENGGNLAENVESLRKWILTTTKDNQELALGVSRAVLKMLSLISEKENWKTATNFHATVKPVKLMQYLVRLITPKNGTVLDPYTGSGTTGIGAKLEGFNFIGIEREEEYIKIADARIDAWEQDKQRVLI